MNHDPLDRLLERTISELRHVLAQYEGFRCQPAAPEDLPALLARAVELSGRVESLLVALKIRDKERNKDQAVSRAALN